jgi:UDP-glucuronate decarboxylase
VSYMFSSSDHILILGATGLFGRHLLPRFLTQYNNYREHPRLSIVTRSASAALESFPYLNRIADIIECDFLHANRLNGLRGCTHILHMASTSARETFSGINQFSKYELLLNSSFAIRELILQGSVRRVLFASSGVAYGSTEHYLESTPSVVSHLQTSSSLMLGKLTAEYILYDACLSADVSYTIARLFSFVSPFLPCDIHYAIGNFVNDAVNNRDIVIRTDGSDLRSYQHLEDAINWILRLLCFDEPPLILNVGSDESLSIYDLALKIKKLTNSSSNIKVLNKPAPSDNARRSYYIPSLELARSLGFSNSVNLNESIIELAQYLEENAKLRSC